MDKGYKNFQDIFQINYFIVLHLNYLSIYLLYAHIYPIMKLVMLLISLCTVMNAFALYFVKYQVQWKHVSFKDIK
jgi:hypothetical protein